MDAGGKAGRARRRCRREWRKALRGAVAEGENRTEYAVLIELSLFGCLFSIIEKDNRIRDNCIFGSVFTSNVVLELEPKVSNFIEISL